VVMFVLWLSLPSLYAATQGSIGDNNSRGSISITLEIPQTTHISAEFSRYPASDHTQLCLHVTDIQNQSPIRFLTVAGLDGDISAHSNAGVNAYERSARVIRSNSSNSNTCSYQSSIKQTIHTDGQQTMLLMVIAE